MPQPLHMSAFPMVESNSMSWTVACLALFEFGKTTNHNIVDFTYTSGLTNEFNSGSAHRDYRGNNVSDSSKQIFHKLETKSTT
jgi:hypothetical protein